jgi:hypothetical protein
MLGRKDKKPPERQWPTTINAALDYLDSHAEPELRTTVRDLPVKRLIDAYRDYGMSIRASLGLWGENPELIACIPEGKKFADHATMFLLELWQSRLQAEKQTND